ncbi:MAG: lysine-sensitive aspartokinase 3 [Alkalimonas sp.]|nr:lysine-sensitive aspartokinase 3 [Alkalimonas sp.]
MSELIVAKFGGTSVADFHAMSRCADIVLADDRIRVVVVSASAGVTNQLVAITQHTELTARFTAFTEIERITMAVLNALQYPQAVAAAIDALLSELRELLEHGGTVFSVQHKDEILSFGERLSSVLFTQVLAERDAAVACFDSRRVVRTDSHFGKGEPQIDAMRQLCAEQLVPVLASQRVVMQGFIGADEHNRTTTLGRGGSDYSAALLTEALDADTVQIWTDVVGIFTTDPRLTEQARCIREISFDEAAEMATFGAKVLHPATLLPAVRRNIRVFVGSSREPDAGGTWIAREVEDRPAYRAIALRKSQTLITVKSPAMLHAAGFLTRVFDILSRHHISVDLVTTSEISVALTLDEAPGSAFEHLTVAAIGELQQFCEVKVEHGLSLVAVIGNHLHSSRGVTGELFQALEGINMRMICHGASKHNLCFLVQDDDATPVVKQLHQSLFAA